MRRCTAVLRLGGRGRCGLAVAAWLLGLPLVGQAAGLALTSQHLTVVRTCALAALSPAAAIGADTYAEEAAPTASFGKASTMTVASWLGADARVYVRLDLARCLVAIPAGATVRTATLRLYVVALSSGCRTLDLFPSPSSWSEATLTWQNQPAGTALNSPPSTKRTAWLQMGSAAGCPNSVANTYVAWNVTGDVAAMVAGAAGNNGWIIRDDSEGSLFPYGESFVTQDAAIPTQAPQLVISYTLV